jgi:hypothetical protein
MGIVTGLTGEQLLTYITEAQQNFEAFAAVDQWVFCNYTREELCDMIEAFSDECFPHDVLGLGDNIRDESERLLRTIFE